MRRPAAAAGSALFFAAAPGAVAGLVPWWLTRWQVRGSFAHLAAVRVAGLVLLTTGVLRPVRGLPAQRPGLGASNPADKITHRPA